MKYALVNRKLFVRPLGTFKWHPQWEVDTQDVRNMIADMMRDMRRSGFSNEFIIDFLYEMLGL